MKKRFKRSIAAAFVSLTATSWAAQSLVFPVSVVGTNTSANAKIEAVVERGPIVPILALAFSPDGKILASGAYQEILLWDLARAQLSKRLASPANNIHALAWNADGKTIFAADGTPGVSGAVRAFDCETGEQKTVLAEAKDEMLCLALSPDGKLLAAGGADGLVRIISLTNSPLTTLKEHSGSVVSVEFSPSGEYLLTAGTDRNVLAWSVEDWKPIARLPQSDAVQGAASSPDGDAIAIAMGNPGGIRLVRFEPETPATPAKDGAKRPRKNNAALAARFFDCGVAQPQSVLWTTNAPVSAWQKKKQATDPTFWKKNLRFYVPCSDGAVKIFNASADTAGALNGHADWVYTAALNPDQTRIATAGADGTIKLWNIANNNLLVTLLQLKPQSSEWLFMTSRGFYSASSPELLKWHTENINRSPEMLDRRLDNPTNVQEIIAGKLPSNPRRKTE